MTRYKLAIKKSLDKRLAKLARRDRALLRAVWKKVERLRADPRIGKPLRAPMQNLRRVHLPGSYVLVYAIDEAQRTVTLIDLAPHDRVYR
ncbi:MAG: addiction module toxin RelE [Euryarchaeota archaeon]|jgi:YafQ family addiction module toxin component|nr:addiction module toxin RelE [Euryarchaeota archaeon]MDP6658274.1 type II toxin-antitoxin system mRNA interferase toxin, RelE/StbE family [Candidatus Poseidoniia archaeon]